MFMQNIIICSCIAWFTSRITTIYIKEEDAQQKINKCSKTNNTTFYIFPCSLLTTAFVLLFDRNSKRNDPTNYGKSKRYKFFLNRFLPNDQLSKNLQFQFRVIRSAVEKRGQGGGGKPPHHFLEQKPFFHVKSENIKFA